MTERFDKTGKTRGVEIGRPDQRPPSRCGVRLAAPLAAVLAAGCFFALVPAPPASAQWPAAPLVVAQNSGDSDDVMDFFLEAIEGVEPSTAPMPPPETPAESPAASPSSPAVSPPPAPKLNLQPASQPDPVNPAPAEPLLPAAPAPSPADDSAWTPLPVLPQTSAPARNTPTAAPPQAAPTSGTIFSSSPAEPDPADPFAPQSNVIQAPVNFDTVQLPPSSALPLGEGTAAPPQTVAPALDDGGSVNWIQLEIGQSDMAAPAPARPGAASQTGQTQRPGSVYSVPPPAPESAAGQRPAPESPPAASVAPAVEAAIDQAIQQPAEARRPFEPEDRQRLKDLFPDMMPQSAAQADAPAGAVSGRPANAPPPPNTGGAGSIQRPLNLPPVEAAPEPSPSPAILRAGELLADEYLGAAEILVPGRDKASAPAVKETPKTQPAPQPQAAAPVKPKPVVVAPPLEKPVKAAAKAKPAAKKTASKTAAKTKPGKASGRKASAKAAPAASAKTSAGLIIINETGRNQVGEQYGSVLRKMGFKVSSVANGKTSGGESGRTVITYRPGSKGQAQSVARHLPGRKVLVEAPKGQVLASEIMIHLR